MQRKSNKMPEMQPSSSQVGVRAIVYYLVTTVFAVILGIILVVSIRYIVIIIRNQDMY